MTRYHGLPSDSRLFKAIQDILRQNFIRIDDDIRKTDRIRQIDGLLQGDSLSPLLFISFVADLPDILTDTGVPPLMYADDLLFFSKDLTTIQKALDKLATWTTDNGLDINEKKTHIMKFRRGGRLKASDKVTYKGTTIEFTNEIEYLGLTLQPTWTFTRHLTKKLTKTSAATYMTKNLDQLSLDGAIKYFRTMISPILTYGLSVIWNDLTKKQMTMIDKCKTTFLKRSLRLPRNSSNRMTTILTDMTTLTEDMTRIHGFDKTENYADYISDIEARLDDIDPDFYRGLAYNDEDWKGPRRSRRHLTTRALTHGFHHRLCKLTEFHDRCDDCECRYCDKPASSLTH